MNNSLRQHAADRHLLRSEIRPRMAKADLRKTETGWLSTVGKAIQRAASLVGWSLKELADHVGRDERQIARWINGAERPQFDALFAVEELRPALVMAIAEMAGDGVELETTIRIRKRA
jgi:ribosome-binding protein aMBF1 (putative translation factor)